jgi:hydrogenase maturation protease
VHLILGYGNELRRDDGVGPRIARAVASWGRRGVQALALHQLTPELAEAVAGADEVVFVDASTGDGAVCFRPVGPDGGWTVLDHISDCRTLLALAEVLYGGRPRAWLVTVPALDLEFGKELSAPAMRGMDEALELIRRHLLAREGSAPARRLRGDTGEDSIAHSGEKTWQDTERC